MYWNHNTRYHDVVLRLISPYCTRALDVGCGRGDLAQEMAQHCKEVVGIDAEPECLASARTASRQWSNLTFIIYELATKASESANP